MRRPNLRPSTVIFVVLALGATVVCVRLGVWQWNRLEERRAYNAEVTRGMSAPPVSLDALRHQEPSERRYRRVTATGSYDVSHELVLYGRAYMGRPGNHVVTPLILADGTAILVDRGWVPFSTDPPPVEGAEPPAGKVVVTGVIEPSDPAGLTKVSGGKVQTMASLHVPDVARRLPYELLPEFLWLQSQNPAQPDGPLPAPLPPLSEGPHAGYMVQWFSFAAIFLLGLVGLVWRDTRRPGRTQD